MRTYFKQSKSLPAYEWDNEILIGKLSEVRYLQGKLAGKMEAIEKGLRNEAILDTLTLEVLKSNEIEGELLNETEVRTLISQSLSSGKPSSRKSNKNLIGKVQILLDATQNYKQSLSFERLNNWNSAISNDSENIVLDSTDELNEFLAWFNSEDDTDPVLKAAISHLVYLSITRYSKGNGRVARVLTEMWLSRADNSSQRFFSMSAQIRKERIAYYDILAKSLNGNQDITPWLIWFLTCMLNSLKSTDSILSRIIFKADFWNKHSKTLFNARQIIMLEKLFNEFQGKLTSSKWAQITRCSPDSALRDMQDLIRKGILVKEHEGGRSTNYELKF